MGKDTRTPRRRPSPRRWRVDVDSRQDRENYSMVRDGRQMAAMQLSTFIGASLCALILLRADTSAQRCEPAGNFRFVCDQSGPEDLAVVPGGQWVVSSGQGARGGIRLINVKEGTSILLFPTAL